MGTFLSNLGSALANYEAAKSPLGSAIYRGATGNSPTDPSGKPVNNIGTMLANAIHPRYKRGAAAVDSNGQPTQPTQPGSTDKSSSYANGASGADDSGNIPDTTSLKEVDSKPAAADPDAGSGHEINSFGRAAASPAVKVGAAAAPGNGQYSSGPSGSNNDPSTGALGNIPSYMQFNPWGWGNDPGTPTPNDPGTTSSSTFITDPNQFYPDPGGGGDEGGGGGQDDGEFGNMARGGIAGTDMPARIAESGPELAGGKIISSPSYVNLKKGEAVIPLTPKAGNRLQPDLLEGHVMQPKVPGVRYSRYAHFGQGRGLMG